MNPWTSNAAEGGGDPCFPLIITQYDDYCTFSTPDIFFNIVIAFFRCLVSTFITSIFFIRIKDDL